MKKLLVAIALLAVPMTTKAQTMTEPAAIQRLLKLEDRADLKELVDTFSNLADTKEIEKQVLLFTEDATVEAFSGEKQTSSLKGRKAIGDAFAAYLANFETVYHINGQQTVSIEGDGASGTAYSLVVLIRHEGGKTVRLTSGVTYKDEYVRQDGKWLISRRTSNFTWSTTDESVQP